MIHKKVNRFARLYECDRDDLFGQALLIYSMACASYNPSKSSFLTYLYLLLEWRLKRYAMKQSDWSTSVVPLDKYLQIEDGCFESSNFLMSVDKLGDDAKHVANTVIANGCKKRELNQFLQRDGWVRWRVRRAFHDVERFVNTYE